ncbi:hypothetical protein QU481_14405 [Crenobacter sp. SG2303]|uniref:Lipoprotein n=1 Tax=Crenobacter oryzisoli TaxID=3056844 RepID=A0ABT7XQL2_9NEIS|nr:hypothetical protein [Crenobacter sp. SG2303]MDN0076078.1 hypothetical protein [Crenobacter sp. SG2303]
MNNKISLLLTALTIAALTSGCTSNEDKLKSFMKCGIAAKQLERPSASTNIEKKLKSFIDEKQITGSAMQAMLIGQSVRDEMALEGKSLQGQIFTLVKIYNSSECKNLHEQESISMPFSYYLNYIFI